MAQVEAEHARGQDQQGSAHRRVLVGDNPPVGEYVRVKDAAHALEAKVRDAERKLERRKAKRRAADANRATRRLLARR